MEGDDGGDGNFAPVGVAVLLRGPNWASAHPGNHCGCPCCLPSGGGVYCGTGFFQAGSTLLGFLTVVTEQEEARRWECHRSAADPVCRRSHARG